MLYQLATVLCTKKKLVHPSMLEKNNEYIFQQVNTIKN